MSKAGAVVLILAFVMRQFASGDGKVLKSTEGCRSRGSYPNADSWGIDGFTCTDKDGAFAKLKEVSRR